MKSLIRLARRPAKNALDRFREAFQNRYEGREVPLVEALDAERGVGFDNPGGSSLEGSTSAANLRSICPTRTVRSTVGRQERGCHLAKTGLRASFTPDSLVTILRSHSPAAHPACRLSRG